MKNLNGFQGLSREELRQTMGGANMGGNDCSSECSSDIQCCENSYCASYTCTVKGNLYVVKKLCQYSGPINTPTTPAPKGLNQ